MVEVRRVDLPGVGVLHSFTTAGGVEVSVIAHRTGSRDLITRLYGEEHAVPSLRLEDEEARTLADLLGGTRIVESIAELDDLPGVPINWIGVDADDALAGHRLGEVAVPEGVTIVAVVRDDDATPAPAPGRVLEPGDLLVAVGPEDGVQRLRRAVAEGPGEGLSD
ncbi:TrkA C-terminal domain-containing protein [Agromyces sp. G08B096]|uniref:TrkA C-terminal domain-containing protein n=1 Tax=Agromyces sp. G08B096 TaxID=3156399 RepID=A0AAU7W977_9MICO